MLHRKHVEYQDKIKKLEDKAMLNRRLEMIELVIYLMAILWKRARNVKEERPQARKYRNITITVRGYLISSAYCIFFITFSVPYYIYGKKLNIQGKLLHLW